MEKFIEEITENMTEFAVQNKDKIEKGVEFLGKTADMLASTVGEIHPLLEVVFKAASKLLSDPEGEDARYLAQKFTQVNTHLGVIENEMKEFSLKMKRMNLNVMNFDNEANMLSQYSKFQEFINAKPKSRERRKNLFISQFENTGRDMNVEALYEGVAEKKMLEIIVETECRNRRAVENFCAGLKKLFVVGIIAVMGYAALQDGNVEEDMVNTWLGRMKDVEIRMKKAVDECVEKFPEQAKEDMKKFIQKNNATTDKTFTDTLLGELKKKYDWVNWSIRAFRDRENFVFRPFVGKDPHSIGGTKCFEIINNNTIVVFSFCVDPKPINKSEIQERVEMKKLKGSKVTMASGLRGDFPTCLVHTISIWKAVVETNDFPEDCFYYWKHSKAHLYIHPE